MKWTYDKDRAERAVNWIETYGTYPDGEKAGDPIAVLPYFKDILQQAFGTVDNKGHLRYSVIYCEVPRGNAKSTNGSLVGLYSLVGIPGKAREVYCCAGSRDQATKVFAPAKIMAGQNEDLQTILRVYEKAIVDTEQISTFKVLAAEGYKQHGHKTDVCIFDELHVQPNSNLWDAMRTSMTKKKDPMLWVFTTAGNTGTFAEEIHNYAVQVQNGSIEDERWLVRIYAADVNDDPFDEEVHKKCNPAWDIINQNQFRATANEAQNSPLFLNTFKRYHLNMWTGAETAFLSIYDWDKGKQQLNIDDFEGLKCYAGLDYAQKRDLSAYCELYPPQGDLTHYTCFVWFWCPEDTVHDKEQTENVNYELWVDQGRIFATEGNFQDQDSMREFIISRLDKVDWQALGIDPSRTDKLRSDLIHHYADYEGLKVRSTKQGEWLNTAIDFLEELVVNGELAHDGNPVMRWQCDNMAVKENLANNRKKVVKRSNKLKIDGFAALLNCIYEYMADEGKEEEITSWMFEKQKDE